MPSLRAPLSVFLLLCAVAVPVATRSGPSAGIAPRLERALADRDGRGRNAAGRLAVWVHFRDRDLSRDELTAALAAAERALDPRAQRRRALRGAGHDAGLLVDAGDLPVSPRYRAAVAATGATPRRQSRWLNAASFDATPAQIAAIAALPFVSRVDLVAKLRRAPLPAPRELAPTAKADIDTGAYGLSFDGLAQINVPAVHAEGWTGSGVVVALLDTGFKLTHEALLHVPVLAAWDFVNDDPIVANEAEDLATQHNHGTWVLSGVAARAPGLLAGPAPEASFLLAKTENVASETPIEEDNWVAGLEWAEGFGADLVSSSLGYYEWYLFEDLDGDTAVTTRAADAAAQRGLLVLTAAGNERQTDWGHILAPADADSALAVGAVYLDGTITYFSSPGPTADGRIKPDVCALGYQVPVVSISDDVSAVAVSGTSLATPLVAGVAALMLQRAPGLTAMQAIEALRATASRAAAPDVDYGWGVVDALTAVHWYGPRIAHAALPDTLPLAPQYAVTCRIEDRAPLDPTALRLVWRADGGPWQQQQLASAGPDSFFAWLPAGEGGALLEYWLEAVDSAGIVAALPAEGADAPLSVWIAYPTAADQRLAARAVLWPPVPNPCNPRAMLRFALARPGSARLELFDLRGRRVKTLVAAQLPAGPHEAAWDGRDEAGRPLAGGTYLARLTAGADVAIRRLVLAR